MKGRKVLVFSRDPGGTNAVMHLIEPLRSRDYEVAVYGKDAALSIYRKFDIPCLDIREVIPSGTQEETCECLQKSAPDLIVTGTSSEDYTERHLWKAAEQVGIKSFAVLDQWTNYRLRLVPEGDEPTTRTAASRELILPSFFFIMDEFARREMSALGINPEKLIVTGQPFFDYIRKTAEKISKPEIEGVRRELTRGKGGLVFVFASQPIASLHRQNGIPEDYWGYTEQTVLKSVVACLGQLSEEIGVEVTLVIRLHPKDEPDAYVDFLKARPHSVKLVFDRETDSSLLLKASDLIIGMFSMILMEAAILGKRFISVQIGLARENPFIFDRMGAVNSILTEEELGKTLREILKGGRQEIPALKFEFGATGRIIKHLEQFT
jgi:hypothetical protein